MSLNQDHLRSIRNNLRKPHVNSTCIGCSACVAISGSVFELDDNGLSRVLHCETYE